jgi:L-amino acid N-acyltransferase YncA
MIEIRPLLPSDWQDVEEIYAQGIATRLATFESETPTWESFDRGHLTEHRLVAVDAGRVVGWVALAPTSGRPCYAGVAEHSVYVAADMRGKGVGRALLEAAIANAEAAGIWTLQTSVFPENEASLKLHLATGFRVVGRRERIARLDGIWRDTILLERRSRAAHAR